MIMYTKTRSKTPPFKVLSLDVLRGQTLSSAESTAWICILEANLAGLLTKVSLSILSSSKMKERKTVGSVCHTTRDANMRDKAREFIQSHAPPASFCAFFSLIVRIFRYIQIAFCACPIPHSYKRLVVCVCVSSLLYTQRLWFVYATRSG